jgi:hypothetical protein
MTPRWLRRSPFAGRRASFQSSSEFLYRSQSLLCSTLSDQRKNEITRVLSARSEIHSGAETEESIRTRFNNNRGCNAKDLSHLNLPLALPIPCARIDLLIEPQIGRPLVPFQPRTYPNRHIQIIDLLRKTLYMSSAESQSECAAVHAEYFTASASGMRLSSEGLDGVLENSVVAVRLLTILTDCHQINRSILRLR